MNKFWYILISVCVVMGVSICPLVDQAWAEENFGAYVERVSYSDEVEMTWYVPPRAELTIINASEVVHKSIFDNGFGIITTSVHIDDGNLSNFEVFYSDGAGISSRIPVDISQSATPVLMPPTIYSIPNINGVNGALGFIGRSFPSSTVKLEIDPSSNNKQVYSTLADSSGDWQIIPPNLSPGKHQAWVSAQFQELQSAWSQEVFITVLAPTDQFIQDLGASTRDSINRVIEGLPTPLKSAAEEIDKSSSVTSKYIFPALLTISTLAQSGILAQNVLYFLYQSLIGLGQLLGLIKKRQPMGLVYDAITKLPLGRAIIRLYTAKDHKLVETDVSTAKGVFSFMPVEGYYYIRVFKPGYIFPSQIVLSSRDGRFTPIYSGGEIQVSREEAIVNVAVPMDPKVYQETWLMKLNRFWQRRIEPLNQWLLLMGFFLSLLSYSRQPTRLNFAIFGLYVMGLLYSWSQGRRKRREYGTVVNASGKPLPGVELILTDVEFNRLVSRRVTDEKGRYQFVAPPGKYQIRMVSPNMEMVTKNRKNYRGEELRVEGERGASKRIFPKIMVKKTG